MDYKEFYVDLQLKENHIDIVRGVVQNDGGNILNLRLMDGTEPFDFSNCRTIEGFIKKPDGTTISEIVGDRLQIVDAERGRLSFLLNGQCTILSGMHYLTIRMYDATTVMSTARLNYYVTENNMADVTEEEIQSYSEWNTLIQIIARWAEYEAAEISRRIAETDRVEAENARVAETTGVVARALAAAVNAENYAEISEFWANAAERIAIGEELPFVTTADLAAALAVLDGLARTLKLRRGAEEDIPVLAAGEPYHATDSQKLFIGTATGNKQLNKQQWVADGVAPEDTELLWIDTANNNCIKFYNGTAWVSTANLTFA